MIPETLSLAHDSRFASPGYLVNNITDSRWLFSASTAHLVHYYGHADHLCDRKSRTIQWLTGLSRFCIM